MFVGAVYEWKQRLVATGPCRRERRAFHVQVCMFIVVG